MPYLFQISPPGGGCLSQQFKGEGQSVIKLEAAAKLVGLVVNKQGEPVPARIILSRPSQLTGDSPLELKVNTTEDGRFQLYPTIGDDYSLMVTPESTHIDKYVPEIRQDIEISGDNTMEIVLKGSDEVRHIKGRIKLQEGETRNFRLRAKAVPVSQSWPDEKHSTESRFCVNGDGGATNGTFDVMVADKTESYELHIWGSVGDSNEEGVECTDAVEGPVQTLVCGAIQIQKGLNLENLAVDWPLLHPLKVSIRVQDAEQQPISQATVAFELVPKDVAQDGNAKLVCTTHHKSRGTTDNYGDATFSLLGPSERDLLRNYVVTVITPSLSHAASLRQPFTANLLGTLHTITLSKRQVLSGQIFDAHGKTIEKMRVQATVLGEHTNFLPTRSTAHTDDRGTFQIPVDLYHRPFSLRFVASPASGLPSFVRENINLEHLSSADILSESIFFAAPRPVVFSGRIDESELPPECQASKQDGPRIRISALRSIRTRKQDVQNENYHHERFEISSAYADEDGRFMMVLPDEEH